jgi:hypothetical protein
LKKKDNPTSVKNLNLVTIKAKGLKNGTTERYEIKRDINTAIANDWRQSKVLVSNSAIKSSWLINFLKAIYVSLIDGKN